MPSFPDPTTTAIGFFQRRRIHSTCQIPQLTDGKKVSFFHFHFHGRRGSSDHTIRSVRDHRTDRG
ncbi:hypothetical protein FrCorBMG51_14575 [Protofrankia coriariae]|uniref:Uncharacterized protein n=1 Tax=Protofrankia coriariae TaxID=1562887 RepID=A0ABR5F2Q6_9ACTN|nr:hypothetical protein FrCorBMG51_14575 [Protofrankia coriariae]